MRAQRRPRRRPGENRERLLAAGISEFGLKGYNGASTADIAALADVPQPHVYANFSTKQALFLACAEQACHTLTQEQVVLPAEQRLRLERMLFQTIAAAGTPDELQLSLRDLVSAVQRALDADAFAAMLVRGAASLLEP